MKRQCQAVAHLLALSTLPFIGSSISTAAAFSSFLFSSNNMSSSASSSHVSSASSSSSRKRKARNANNNKMTVPKYPIGTQICKGFDGISYKGKIISFDSKEGYYKVKYDDGDQEELEHEEVEQYLMLAANSKDDSVSKQGGATIKYDIPTIQLHTVNADNQKRTDVHLPIVGLGTYKFKKASDEAYHAVLDALSVGIRHIDTAFIYGGETIETEIGRALTSPECSVPRSDIFLTSKQWRAYHGYDATTKCLNLSLKRLQTEYLDLYLIHWPGPAYNTMSRSNEVMANSDEGPFVYAKDGHEKDSMVTLRAETWRAMEDAVYAGKCRAIGVSNFTIKHLEALRKKARIWPPAVNQVELHPYSPQPELVEYCRKHGIAVEAYASLGGQDSGKKTWKKLGGKLTEREEVQSIARKHNKTEEQTLLRWATQQKIAVIPKTGNIGHMRANIEAVISDGWTSGGLDDDDMQLLGSLNQYSTADDKARLCWVRDPLKHLDFD